MKKFLLLLACIGTYFAADALELTFWLGDKKITPGQTIEFNDITVSTDDGYKDVAMKPAIFIQSSLYSSDVKISANCTSGQTISLCAGQTCSSGKSVTKENITLRTNEKLDIEYHYFGDFDLDEEIPAVTSIIEAEDVTEPQSKVQFIITMCDKNASVTAIEIFEDLTPVDGGVQYRTEEARDLTISTLSGLSVFDATVTGEGSVSLAKGLYVYSFGSRSGKILVK